MRGDTQCYLLWGKKDSSLLIQVLGGGTEKTLPGCWKHLEMWIRCQGCVELLGADAMPPHVASSL